MADKHPHLRPLNRSTTSLPEGFEPIGEIDLSSHPRAALALNLVGVVLIAVFGWLFSRLAGYLHPTLHLTWSLHFNTNKLVDASEVVFLLIAITVLVIVFHEGLHGLFFWAFTGRRPEFGIRGAYAYAAAPDWYIPRNRYILIGLAPLIGLTFLGIIGLRIFPEGMALPLILFMTINASGAVGDILVVGWLLKKSDGTLARDRGDKVVLYGPRQG